METRLGVEPSRTWSAATCLAVRPTRHGSEGRARTCATWLTARHDCRYINSDRCRHGESNPALWYETPASSPADSGGLAESEGVEPSSVTSPSLFSRQVAGLPAALSVAEGERIERPRARRRARLPVSNGTPYLSGNLPRRAAGRRG